MQSCPLSILFVICVFLFGGCDPATVAPEPPNDDNAPILQEEPPTPQNSEDVREIGPPQDLQHDALAGPVDNDFTVPDATQDSPLRDLRPPSEEEIEPVYVEKQTIEIAKNWARITPVGTTEVWVDTKAKQVMVAGRICLDRGGLEMFICPFNTKEHESVIAVNAQSFQIHAALLAIGANPGKPVQWEPEYQTVSGPIVEIDITWKGPDGKLFVEKAQTFVRNFETKKNLELDWVFGGSILETDEESGRSFYYADGGELVCLSNFSTATLDIPVQSSESNENLLFEANPDTIPAPGTKVYVIFKPKLAATEPHKQ